MKIHWFILHLRDDREKKKYIKTIMSEREIVNIKSIIQYPVKADALH